MKYFIYTIIFLALVFIGISVSVLDFQNLTEGDSGNALVVILASLCVIALMAILLVSRSISKKHS
ncbi:hypothetical protein NE848_10640 [Gramella jeungdoensis]|uniref:Uncharacterized protein n=1 Tax=Gramella jeungdoensis TaxID=708091 RepID=A0ABT0Z299_9FLAO|nr:hypothetical protein [Gramella jeungdoensis]MCM8569839.1 hypothetical protein [Gramella jeungdoensis]